MFLVVAITLKSLAVPLINKIVPIIPNTTDINKIIIPSVKWDNTIQYATIKNTHPKIRDKKLI